MSNTPRVQSNRFHSEIEYTRANGEGVHSDLMGGDFSKMVLDSEARQMLHDALDEWLNNSNGTGHFVISSEKSPILED